MKKMESPYQKEDSVLFGIIYRPIIDFEVKTEFGLIPVLAYVDFGADITLLPRLFLYFLDLKFTEDEVTVQRRGRGGIFFRPAFSTF